MASKRKLNINRFTFVVAPNSSKFWIVAPLAYTFFIQFLTGIPKPEGLEKTSANDLLLTLSRQLFDYPYWLQDLSHLPLFFVFAWLWAWFFRRSQKGTKGISITVGVSLSFALINELLQFYIPHRFPSMGDIVMNVIGVLTALILHQYICRKWFGPIYD